MYSSIRNLLGQQYAFSSIVVRGLTLCELSFLQESDIAISPDVTGTTTGRQSADKRPWLPSQAYQLRSAVLPLELRRPLHHSVEMPPAAAGPQHRTAHRVLKLSVQCWQTGKQSVQGISQKNLLPARPPCSSPLKLNELLGQGVLDLPR